MALFANLLYGVVPTPESPIWTTFKVVKTDAVFMGGQATRKEVSISFENTKGSAEMLILVFSPNGGSQLAPAFLLHSFGNTRDNGHDTPALAAADVGIAMGSGTNVAIESAGLTLVKGDLRGIVSSLRLSRQVMRNIRQNLFSDLLTSRRREVGGLEGK